MRCEKTILPSQILLVELLALLAISPVLKQESLGVNGKESEHALLMTVLIENAMDC